eukprot:CAMPEP_0179117188 /NCGR_PEP_ID=MMETSP0796-20121207/55023_1 /TAXON_ID=73915 /ORGANISM="Pyrodinium bahamense, Strain pbaha01" /LENGTH=173 /DNA_ID=CAMNT_0020815535 /DNA_START=69 /DNA_END=587 /DNA_ORIENTATION=+
MAVVLALRDTGMPVSGPTATRGGVNVTAAALGGGGASLRGPPAHAHGRRGIAAAQQSGGPRTRWASKDGDSADKSPTLEIEESKSRANGDKTLQAVIRLREPSGRERLVRGRPRTSKEDAQQDGDEMMRALKSGGAEALRKVQVQQGKADEGSEPMLICSGKVFVDIQDHCHL